MEAAASMHLGACESSSTSTLSPLSMRLTICYCIRNDFGIRCIIAPSFADIFRNNTFQNGMLPIVLPKDVCRELGAEAEAGVELEIDLEKHEIRRPNGKPAISFEIDPFRRHCLLNGLDDIGLTLQKANAIEEFESRRSTVWPWLDGFGYKGRKITVAAGRSGNKMDW